MLLVDVASMQDLMLPADPPQYFISRLFALLLSVTVVAFLNSAVANSTTIDTVAEQFAPLKNASHAAIAFLHVQIQYCYVYRFSALLFGAILTFTPRLERPFGFLRVISLCHTPTRNFMSHRLSASTRKA